MRISDWSSYVCSSDLADGEGAGRGRRCHEGRTLSRMAPSPGDPVRPLPRILQRAESVGCRWAPQPERRDQHTDHPVVGPREAGGQHEHRGLDRSEEHTSELQSLMRISYAVFCLKKKKKTTK